MREDGWYWSQNPRRWVRIKDGTVIGYAEASREPSGHETWFAVFQGAHLNNRPLLHQAKQAVEDELEQLKYRDRCVADAKGYDKPMSREEFEERVPPLADNAPWGLSALRRKKMVEDEMVFWILEHRRAVKTPEHARETIRCMYEDKYRGLFVGIAWSLISAAATAETAS